MKFSSIFSDVLSYHRKIKLEININGNSRSSWITCRLNNTLFSDLVSIEEMLNIFRCSFYTQWNHKWLQFLCPLMCLITFIEWHMLSYICFPGKNSAWSWHIIILMHCWIQFAYILLKVCCLSSLEKFIVSVLKCLYRVFVSEQCYLNRISLIVSLYFLLWGESSEDWQPKDHGLI